MPYYLAIIEDLGGDGNGEWSGRVWDRPISFREKLWLGPREYRVIGKRPVHVEVNSHDLAVITAVRAVTVLLEEGAPIEEIFDLRHPVSEEFESGRRVRSLKLLAG